jgi:hypothetical protein
MVEISWQFIVLISADKVSLVRRFETMRQVELLVTSVMLTAVLTFAGYYQETKAISFPNLSISQRQD